jgi:hypothetical protein
MLCSTYRQKMLCCYWQAEDAMFLMTGRIFYVITDNQHQVGSPAATVAPERISCTCFFAGDNIVHVMCSGMTAVWLVVTRVSSYCIACEETVKRGCSTTRGRWFGSGLPVEERQTCCCIRRGVRTAHFSLTAVLASSIIRSCDATFLHTPLPHSRFSDLRVTVVWLLRTIIRLLRRTNTHVNTKNAPEFHHRYRHCPKFGRSSVQVSD